MAAVAEQHGIPDGYLPATPAPNLLVHLSGYFCYLPAAITALKICQQKYLAPDTRDGFCILAFAYRAEGIGIRCLLRILKNTDWRAV
jgi:hypothetical protein